MSVFRTGILVAGLSALFLICGYLLGSERGMLIAVIFSAVIDEFSFWKSDRFVLRTYRAWKINLDTAIYFMISLPIIQKYRLPNS